VRSLTGLHHITLSIQHLFRKREALEGLEWRFRIGGRVINNPKYADDVVLIVTTEKDLQELVDRVFTVTASLKAGLSINKEKA